MITPKQFWGNPNTAGRWIRRVKFYRKNGDDSDIRIVKMIGNKFEFVLEVGAGNGRIIGELSKKKKVDCYSVDINEELSEYVQGNYPKVHVYSGSNDVIDLPFGDNQFDLIYTYQVLQHVGKHSIHKALRELKRVAKKEVWLFEGWGNLKKWGMPNGHMRHGGDGGTFYWDLEKMIDCYDVSFFTNNGDTGIKLYRIKV